MNFAELQKKLIAAARAHPPSAVVPFAFEKRIMARLASGPLEDPWLLWGVALWRGAAASVAICLLASYLFSVPFSDRSSEGSDLETTVAAAAQDLGDTW